MNTCSEKKKMGYLNTDPKTTGKITPNIPKSKEENQRG